ncbi:hypothetical protein EV188_109118 [Actinomycetospora succinea]|uniref:Uncharacterized protein n=1 Tax=Actinomycetospora succinea TaxID=663603 RepID=A0A4R6UUD0_9PSEU|nr:hypothetical protein [Actinomycetospora succinea]TDQ50910.1 hypothetical protein EV188_109118 [Actinomycetospora succinea]
MTAAASFYQLLSTVSFTLLGLWFVVLGLSHGSWRSGPERHRATLHVALHFFLPGTMGLGAVLAGEAPVIWRVTFLLGAAIGVVEAVGFLRPTNRPRGRLERGLASCSPVLYLLVGAAALVPRPLAGLAPLQIEGMATALVFLVGMVHIWLAYAERQTGAVPDPRRAVV